MTDFLEAICIMMAAISLCLLIELTKEINQLSVSLSQLQKSVSSNAQSFHSISSLVDPPPSASLKQNHSSQLIACEACGCQGEERKPQSTK